MGGGVIVSECGVQAGHGKEAGRSERKQGEMQVSMMGKASDDEEGGF